MRTLLEDLENEARRKNTRASLYEFEMKHANFYRDQARAGQVPPGEVKGALRLSQGALARPKSQTRRIPEDSGSSRYTFGNIYGQHAL